MVLRLLPSFYSSKSTLCHCALKSLSQEPPCMNNIKFPCSQASCWIWPVGTPADDWREGGGNEVREVDS